VVTPSSLEKLLLLALESLDVLSCERWANLTFLRGLAIFGEREREGKEIRAEAG